MRIVNWFYLMLMAAIIWGLVLMHKPPLQTLVMPTSFALLHSSQTSLPSQEANWQNQDITSLTLPDEAIWLKFTLPLNEDTPLPNGAVLTNSNKVKTAKGLFISVLGAYSVYFNGEFIGSNGIPAIAGAPEVPGNIDSVFLLPPHLIMQGSNTVMIRFSSQFRPDSLTHSGVWVFADDYSNLININEERTRLPIMMLSALLLVALYSFVVYFSSLNNATYLWFGSLSFTLILLIVAESWRGLFGYPYPWHVVRMEVVLWLTLAISVLLPMFFVAFFRYTKRVATYSLCALALLYTLIMLFVDGYDYRSFVLFGTGLVCSIAVCIASLIARKQHAWLMTTGLMVFISPVVLSRFSFMDQYFFVSFIGLALLMLMVLNQTQSERQRAFAQSKLTTQRLELELVKKQLQPHFILNTLTAIEEWVDTSPKDAVAFIQALAQEFRQMAQLSNQSLVTFEQELALCESHLKIMGYRFDAKFELIKRNINLQQRLPPGILLTLIENAFSHNRYDSQTYSFYLEGNTDRENAKVTSVIFKSMRSAGASSIDLRESDNNINGLHTGVGNKYVKARLQEAYGDLWSFKEHQEADFWVVTLTFPASEKANKHEDSK